MQNNKVYVVTYWEEDKTIEPVVTVFNNYEAAHKYHTTIAERHFGSCLDVCDVYSVVSINGNIPIEMIAPIEKTEISSRKYTIIHGRYGKIYRYLIYNEKLYKTIKDINIGDKLVIDENIKPTTIMDEIYDLWHETNRIWCYG